MLRIFLALMLSASCLAFNIGDHAPRQDIKHYNPDGSTHTADFTSRKSGNKLLIVHGFAHCPWFKGSWIYLEDFQNNNPDITIKLVLSDHSRGEIDDFISQFHNEIPFIFMPTLRATSESLSHKLSAVYSASFWLLDSQNKLIGRHIGMAYPRVLKTFREQFNKEDK